MRDMTTGHMPNKYKLQPKEHRAKFKEPLYNLGEIAEKLGMHEGKLRIELGVKRTEGAPEAARKSTSSGKHLYRLSDFKKYFKMRGTLQ